MTERKPVRMSFESFVDRQIREAQERGDFDNLAGAGKPLPSIERPLDPMQWAASWVRREGYSTDTLLPTPLQLRKEVHQLPETVRDLPTEQAVRNVVADLNQRIKDWIRLPANGPRVIVPLADEAAVVEQWRTHRAESAKARPSSRETPPSRQASRPASGEAMEPRTRWWHRLTGRRR